MLPGKGKRTYRLAMARRIVDRTGGPPERRRSRVLRKAMRPSRRSQTGLGPWLRAVPAPLPDPAPTDALARLEAPVRVAWVLLNVAGLPGYRVHDELVSLRVRDPWKVIEAAEAAPIPDATVPDPLPAALRRPVRRRPVVPIAAAAALTATLVGVLVVTENGGSLMGGSRPAAAGNLRLVAAAPGGWAQGPHRLDAWPARGELVRDRAFTTRALNAWAARGDDPQRRLRGDAQLLYAGRVDGTPVAILRHGDRVARYTEPGGALEVRTAGAEATAPLALGGGRYLLSPWDAGATVPGGGPVEVRDGVTAPVAVRTRCGRGPVLDLRGTAGHRTVGDLGGARPVVLAYRPPTHHAAASESASEPVPASHAAHLDAAGIRFWERLGCLLPQPARPVIQAMAWDFWSGRLPHDGARADWACTRLAFAGGGTTAQSTLLDERSEHATGWCDDRRPVAGTWWQAPDPHTPEQHTSAQHASAQPARWYYLAAAARGLRPHAEGPLRGAKVAGRLLVARSAEAGRRPDAPVALTARTG
ncbi:hypothetical protein [Actinomadura hibisca]|uniref:hypothetical protein n=1 Tax=Actinomadura hibisca TaxID=68565 RepID=UPI00082E0770|nr:hypothetical protein [Actinomadura hibisca]